jgi:threonyl-tRNA synthetase
MSEAAAFLNVRLPDGKVLQVPPGGKIDGGSEVLDLRYRLKGDCTIEIVTDKTADGVAVLRHSASHIMADAITKLWPEVKLTIGPSTDEGFYYDVDLETRITPEDLPRIEAEMAKIVAADTPFERCEIYKVELIEGFDPNDEVTVYRHGNGGFEDLCRGPHVPSTGYVKAFKLLSIAGAYWRGDEKNKMLQRIYGTAFASQKDLDAYLKRLEEAKARDHRKLGRELGLFMMNPIAPASPFFLPRGATLYNRLQRHMRELYVEYGYQEVITPQVFDAELFKKSGHWDHYRDNMFVTRLDDRDFGVKPMNCPGHTYVFAADKRSYRELPLRIADFGRLHRYERSGVTGGLTRVRTFCQDDAHVFAAPEQIKEEIASLLKMIGGVYDLFGFGKPKIFLSTRPASSLGSDELWAKAEASLAEALAENGVAYKVNKGDGAFYGPKIDFVVEDAIGRDWQLGTIQLDFQQPLRFDLKYTTREGTEERPVMIHRAILGSLERFIGILIEQCSGNFPFWLAPEQARLLTVGANHVPYAKEVLGLFRERGFRVELDSSDERVGSKVRDARLLRIPYVLTIGDKEVAGRTLSVRERPDRDLGAMALEKAFDFFAELERSKK